MSGLRVLGAAIGSAAIMLTGMTPVLAQEGTDSAAESTGATETPPFLTPKTPPTGPLAASVGQSVQIRLDANGEANSQAGMLRWAVTQVTASGEGDGEVVVPMQGSMFRSLEGFSKPEFDGTQATFKFEDVQGVAEGRTLDLYPMDATTPISLTVKYFLDGQEVRAEDVVGKDGALGVEYTITNNTTKLTPVTFTNVQGQPETREVEVDQPFVVQASATIPQQYTGLSTGTGQIGADGMGGNQIAWVALPFRPLSKDGTAKFGWSANVTDAQIPPVLIQAAPVYIPAEGSPTQAGTGDPSGGRGGGLSLGGGGGFGGGGGGGGGGAGAGGANVATAASGVATMVSGLKASMDVVGQAVNYTGAGIQAAGADISASLQQICAPALLDCANISGGGDIAGTLGLAAIAVNNEANNLQTPINNLNAQIAELQTTGATNYQQLVDTLNLAATGLGAAGGVANTAAGALNSSNPYLQDFSDICRTKPEEDQPGADRPLGYCTALSAQLPINSAAAAANQGLGGELQGIAEQIRGVAAQLPTVEAVTQREIATLQNVVGVLSNVQGGLYNTSANLISTRDLINGLKPPLAELQAGIGEITTAIAGGVDQLAELRNTVPSIVSGGGELKAGIGGIGDSAKAYLGEAVSLALTAKGALVTTAAVVSGAVDAAGQAVVQVEEKVTELGARANTMKSEVAGLVQAAGESPLPYAFLAGQQAAAGVGPAVTQAAVSAPAQDGEQPVVPITQVFGAYEFRLDPANNVTESATGRTVFGVGLLGLTGAGAYVLARRSRQTATAGASAATTTSAVGGKPPASTGKPPASTGKPPASTGGTATGTPKPAQVKPAPPKGSTTGSGSPTPGAASAASPTGGQAADSTSTAASGVVKPWETTSSKTAPPVKAPPVKAPEAQMPEAQIPEATKDPDVPTDKPGD